VTEDEWGEMERRLDESNARLQTAKQKAQWHYEFWHYLSWTPISIAFLAIAITLILI
jgi:hypothetical protein